VFFFSSQPLSLLAFPSFPCSFLKSRGSRWVLLQCLDKVNLQERHRHTGSRRSRVDGLGPVSRADWLELVGGGKHGFRCLTFSFWMAPSTYRPPVFVQLCVPSGLKDTGNASEVQRITCCLFFGGTETKPGGGFDDGRMGCLDLSHGLG
jgi:hypothetical protein